MSVDTVITKLERVKRTGPGKWRARCPAHHGRSASLAISETDDGRILIHCFAGCPVESVLSAMGLQFEDLMEPLPTGAYLRVGVRRPWSTAQGLELIAFEATLLAIVMTDLTKGDLVSAPLKARVLQAVGRITHVVDTLRA